MAKILLEPFKGRWEFTKMDEWELVEPIWFIEFDGQGNGSFHFLSVDADIDYRVSNEGKRAEFTFNSDDEYDDLFGHGWVEIDDGELRGYICFHPGEESTFTAKQMKFKR